MGLSEALSSAISTETWHNSIRPKIQGTWNLRSALRDRDREARLDFFVMTSSISGTAGTATESNCCLGNAFLDLFTRFCNKSRSVLRGVGYDLRSRLSARASGD